MSRKAVFFDADGTVCDMKKGVPDSAIEAIRALVDNGHEAWLCTGRSRAFVSWYLEQIPGPLHAQTETPCSAHFCPHLHISVPLR